MKVNNKKYPFAVFFSDFHGGKFISNHKTVESAENTAKKNKFEDCVCGCTEICLNFVPTGFSLYEEIPGIYSDKKGHVLRLLS